MDGAVGRRRRRRGQKRTAKARWNSAIHRGVTVFGWLCVVALFFGAGYGSYVGWGGVVGNGVRASTRTPAVETPIHAVRLVALGDSLTHGFGDASGRGFVGDVVHRYRSQNRTVVQANLGIDGLTSTQLLKQVRQPSVQNLIRQATVVLISIGGNDLNQAALPSPGDTKRVNQAESTFLAHLRTLVNELRTLNATAEFVFVGLYNPYASIRGERDQTDAIVTQWNASEMAILSGRPHTVLVPTFDLFEGHLDTLLYQDHFHPNQTGYQRIADRIWTDLES